MGAFIWLNKQTPQQADINEESASGIQEMADTARLKAKQASMKAFVAGMIADWAKYYGDAKNTMPFDQNPSVKQSMEVKISALKEKYPGDYSLKIYGEYDVSIKLAETTSSTYVCIDSITAKVIDISSSEFSKQTDCVGQTIK